MASKKSVARAAGKVKRADRDEVKHGKQALATKVKAKAPSPGDMTAAEEAALTRVIALLETGFLAIAADGVVDEAELRNLGGNFAEWLGQNVPVDALVEVVEGFARALHDQGFGGRLAYLAGALDEPGRLDAFHFAAMLAACDGEVNAQELGVLGEIAEAFEIPEEVATADFRQIYEQVMNLGD